ncbi:MAG: BMP family ABC transporter substrate-binding protein [Clostridiales bacterium]|nr:BMP family ABC transporter substrate-binding protein [Clostridiales bacterium]
MKIRKLLALAAAATMALSCTAVSVNAEESAGVAVEDLKVGVIYIGDENEGYTAAHMEGVDEMMEALGVDESQVIEKTLIGEDETCADAAFDLADQGCQIIFATSFGHESYLMEAAAEYPDIEFCHATGYQAASSGLSNMHNYFDSIYEARYVSGVVAGMKLNEMIADGTISSDAVKIGYVGAYPYAEVISGFTSFYLGVTSVCPEATMEVKYTNSWASFDLEKECAEALIADGCVLISQHADTTGAPTACEAAGVPCVGYNVSMIETAPTTALVSASNNWGIYYTYAVQCVLDGEDIDVDWCQGYSEGAVCITDLNEDVVAEGTAEAVEEVIASISDGSMHVFDTSTWTVDGETLDTYEVNGIEYISDGYFHESEYGSAPAFDIIIDGITSVVE